MTTFSDLGIPRVGEWLITSHLDTFGGYEYDWMVIGDKLVIAALDNMKDRNRTLLERHYIADLLEAEGQLDELMASGDFDDINDAMFELFSDVESADPQ